MKSIYSATIFVGIALILMIVFGRVKFSILLIYKHGRSLYYLGPFLFRIFKGFIVKLFHIFIRFSLLYFVLFFVGEIVSFISLSVCLSLVYRKATDFCVFYILPIC